MEDSDDAGESSAVGFPEDVGEPLTDGRDDGERLADGSADAVGGLLPSSVGTEDGVSETGALVGSEEGCADALIVGVVDGVSDTGTLVG